MEVIKFMYENLFSTICLVFVVAVAISGIVLAFKGKNFWDSL